MKRFLILLSLLFCNVVFADTINLHWINYDGTTYQDSTCEIDSDLILPSTPPTRYGYTFTGWKISNYIPIEYLEGTGTQWINTGFMFTGNSGQVDLEYEQTRDESTIRLFGYWLSTSDNSLTLRLDSSYYLTWTGSTEILKQNKVYSSVNTKHKVVNIFNNGTSTIIFDNQTYVNSYNNSISENGQVCYLFAMKYPGATGGVYGIAPVRIYYVKIYDNNDLVRDMIPVLDENNIPCMYDKVEQKFYYNQGTGQFIAGPSL